MSLASQVKLLAFCSLLLRILAPSLARWVFAALPLLAPLWLICRSIWPGKAPASSTTELDLAHKSDGQATISGSLVQVDGDATSGATVSGVSADARTIRASTPAPGEEEDRGPEGVQCQCCFEYYPFGEMVQCPEAHLFCFSCISTYASTKLGADDCSINCIHPSGCVLPFPPSELKRVLHPKLMSHYELVKRQKEVEAASLEEQMEYKENLLRCGREGEPCGVVSCGMCQENLLSKSCKNSMEEDKLLHGRHVIEEAMTRALIRNCPQCQKAFVKELGCNKMMCPKCLTLSCYICRQVITGYEHFDDWPVSASTAGAKCVLWDSVEERHADEVEKAAERAIREYKQAHPDVDESAIKVDLPPEPPRTDNSAPGLPGHVPAFPYPFPALYPPGYNPYAANILPPAGGRGPAYDPLMGLYQPPYFGPPVPVERDQNQNPMVDRLPQQGRLPPAEDDLPPEPPRTNDGLPGHIPAFPYPFPALYPPGYNPYAANILPPAGGRGPAYDPLMGFYQPPYFGPPFPVEQNQHQYPMVDRLQQHGLIQPGAPAPAPVPPPPSQSLSGSLPGLRGFFNKPRPQPKPGQSSKCTQDRN